MAFFVPVVMEIGGLWLFFGGMMLSVGIVEREREREREFAWLVTLKVYLL